MLTFEQPLLLLFLLPIAVLVYFTWRNMSLPFPRPQRFFILACRLALFLFIIAALSGAALSQRVSHEGVVFVGDISDSTQTQRAFMEQWITSAIQHKRSDDQVGIVAVGRNALVEQSVKSQIDFAHFESTPDTQFTDLAAGLRLAAAILPPDSLRRIVLLSDGQQNLGDALQEARLLQQQGIRLDIVPIPTFNGADARINGLTAPTELRTNERFQLHTKLYSTVAQDATLHLYLDQTLLLPLRIHLTGGEQEITFSLLAPPPGFHTYRVTLNAPQDSIPQNDEASAFVNVQGPPSVLVIEGQPGNGHNIIAALQATKINVTTATPADLPTTLDGLAAYSSVILADVPAVSLGNQRMQILQSYVRDLGRGLVVSGGENSYGVGGYADTPLEQTLPVRMDIPQHKDSPTIAVVLIIESLESSLPINISKEAAKGVVSLLTPRDQVGISEGSGVLVIPMQHVTNKTSIDNAITAMDPSDPGSYLPDLINAETALLKTDAKIKHVILLGDGDATDNYAPQVLKMAGENISVSTVATNAMDYSQLGIMQQIAGWGKGRFYRADDPAAIPQILLQETQQAARRAIINEPFVPAVVGSHPILKGIGPLPSLNGYVATTPKPAAQLVLVSHLDDPVLAVWQYGLGRVAAWTSDALGLWTAHWIPWSDYAHWWANVVTWTLPAPDSALNINGTIVGGTGQLSVDLPAGTTVGANAQQQVQVRIITPELTQETVTLQATAPLRWEGTFPAFQVGAYLLQVTWRTSTGHQSPTSQLTASTGLVVPYSPEYRTTGTDLPFLNQLAQAGGGAILKADDTAAAFAQNLAIVWTAQPIAFFLLILAALLLPIDIAVRRLSSLDFLVDGFRWLVARLSLSKPQPATQVMSSGEYIAGLSTLRTRREERRIRAIPTSPATSSKQTTPSRPTQQIEEPSVPRKVQSTQAGSSVTEQLLEAKRQRTQRK